MLTHPSNLSPPQAPRWMRASFMLVILLFPILDITAALLYHYTGSPLVGALRYVRDGACLMLALAGFFSRNVPPGLRRAAGAYAAILFFYALASFVISPLKIGIMIGSLGTLLIPVTLTFASFAAVQSRADLSWMVRVLVVYGLLSTLFGFWEINHTEFWTDSVSYGNYIWDIKHYTTGFQPDVFLPWNFVGLDGARRAAGLIGAPLAQGFFLAVVGLTGFAYWRGRSLLLAASIATLCLVGTLQSGTRSAMFAAGVGALVYFLHPRRHARTRQSNLLLVGLFLVLAMPTLMNYFLTTIRQEDDSTPGHLAAFAKNLSQIGDVTLLGMGIGEAGGISASSGHLIQGGGEGAIFTIAFQVGIPGAFLFLVFFGTLIRTVYRERYGVGTHGELALALSFLAIGVIASALSSEHILTFSGMGAYWLLVGGFLGYTRRASLADTEQRAVFYVTPPLARET